MAPTSYEIQVMKGRSWEVLHIFPPSEKARAQQLYAGLNAGRGYQAKKLVEETVGDDGRPVLRTMSLRMFEIETTAIAPAPAAKRSPKVARRGDGRPRKPGLLTRIFGFLFEEVEAARQAEAGRAADTTGVVGADAIGSSAQESARPTVPIGAITGSQTKSKNLKATPNSSAYQRKFKDEASIGRQVVLARESTSVLARQFFEYVHRHSMDPKLSRNPMFCIGIGCFVVGALERIDDEVDIATMRGRTLLADCVKIFLSSEKVVADIVGTVSQFVSQSASRRFLDAGAMAFDHYAAGRLRALRDLLKSAFTVIPADERPLGTPVDIGIVFTEVTGATVAPATGASAGGSAIADRHERIVENVARTCQGRIVKYLGDGVMVAFDSAEATVRFLAMGLIVMRGGDEAPGGKFRLAGHFGPALEKDGDYFGDAVQVAARLLGRAGPGEACMLDSYEDLVEDHQINIARSTVAKLSGHGEEQRLLHLQ